MKNKWIHSGLILFVLLVCSLYFPSHPIDPWNLISFKKIASTIFALAFAQVLGSVMIRILGVRTGAILSGFFSGLISSTATTAAVAKKSKLLMQVKTVSEILVLISATIAMLFEAMLITLLGTESIHYSLLIIFIIPILTSFLMLFFISKKSLPEPLLIEDSALELLPLLKLSGFILTIIAISKTLKNIIGINGLSGLTFLVSLFEIHGSIIANMQLHDSGNFDVLILGNLIALSIAASYVSKFFIVFTLGSPFLKKQTLKFISILLFSLGLSWLIFYFISTKIL